MTGMLVTVLLICMSHCVYSKSYRESLKSPDDIAECIFAIKKNASIRVTEQHYGPIQVVQNIGRTPVQVKQYFSKVTLRPCSELKFYESITISVSVSELSRAIVYVSDCSNSVSKVYIEEPEEGYDKNKVLWGTATLGVKHIPEHQNLSTLISTFWPEKKENMWQQIYAVIKDLLDHKTQQIISKILNEDIKDIKDEMVALNNITENNLNNDDFKKKYMELIDKLKNIETGFTLKDNEMSNFYIIPLYTNVVTMEMYFFALGLINDKMKATIREIVKYQLIHCINYLYSTANKAFDEIYDTGYAGGLYNVMMNARSYYAWHTLELIPEWSKVYEKCFRVQVSFGNIYTLPISYSNLYGRATPNLLKESIRINKTTRMLNKYSIIELKFYIIKTNEQVVNTVYGLELLKLSLNKDHSTTVSMGNCILTDNIDIDSLDLTNNTIIKLKVYKTAEYIRCLEFRLPDDSTKRVGDHCEDNCISSEFFLEGHYIYSFYLENDYPETGKYFDNVAVEFLPYWS